MKKEVKSQPIKVIIKLEQLFATLGDYPIEAEVTLCISNEQELLSTVSEFYRLYLSKLNQIE